MNLWDRVLGQLQQTLDQNEYETWFQATSLLVDNGDSLDIRVPNQSFVRTLSRDYIDEIRAILDDLSADQTTIHFIPDSDEASTARRATPSTASPELPSSNFNPRYRFESFIVGNSNQLAYAASLSTGERRSVLTPWRGPGSSFFGKDSIAPLSKVLIAS